MSKTKRSKRPNRTGWLWVVAVVAIFVTMKMNRTSDRPTLPPLPDRLDRMTSRALSAHVAVTGPVGAAHAAAAWQAKVRPEPDPPEPSQTELPSLSAPSAELTSTGGVIVKNVRSLGPHPDRNVARRDAAVVAGQILKTKLAELGVDSPTALNDATLILERFVISGSIREDRVTDDLTLKDFKKNNLSTDQAYVSLDAEITPNQIRQLRAADRVWTAVRVIGAGLVGLLAVLAFLQFDSATKGYLTWGLALGLAGAAVGTVVGLLYLIRAW